MTGEFREKKNNTEKFFAIVQGLIFSVKYE